MDAERFERWIKQEMTEYEMNALRTRCKCVDAMGLTKDKRVKRTLRKICK